MKLLFIYPFCSPEINSISGGPLYLGANGHEVLLVTSRVADSLKGRVSAPEQEQFESTEFYRPFAHSRELIDSPFVCWQQLEKKITEFQPDAIFGFGEFNYKLLFRIKNQFEIPLYLYMEYLRQEKIAFPMRGRSIMKRFLPAMHNWFAAQFQKKLSKNVKAIMYAYYGDSVYAEKVASYGAPVHYVPWCNEVYGRTEAVEKNSKKDKSTGLYIGSLEEFKNAAELVKAIPIILEQTNTSTFTVVGPGTYAVEIKKLLKQYPNRLFYKESIPRSEAMQMIRNAGYGFTPVKDCGLGFIGDCWSSSIPLISIYDLEGFLNNGVDTLVINNIENLSSSVNNLIKTEALYNSYCEKGLRRYNQNYTAQAVGERYLMVAKTDGVEGCTLNNIQQQK